MKRQRLNHLEIHTPEGCTFALPLAGPVTRFLAWLTDLAAVLMLSWVIGTACELVAAFSRNAAYTLYFLLYFMVWFGYGIFFEWFFHGQTLGKRIFALRVMDEQGLRITFSQILIRNLLRIADMLPALYVVGGVSCLVSRRAQRLGDLAAGTVVVRIQRLSQPNVSRLLEGKFNSMRQHVRLAARLRQLARPEEARIALMALSRREGLNADARVELFGQIARHFRSLVPFPQEATEGLSDEQYVRNVVEILFASGYQGTDAE
jgi:uncharacterized RDD family membrane protein YckC